MKIEPKCKGFICITAHPQGCKMNVKNEIDYVEKQGKISGAKNVLIIGASTGYGLASSVVSTIACDANVIGVSFEKEGTAKRTATPGWYNIESLKKLLEGRQGKFTSVNGDAFSFEIKNEVINLIKEKMNKVDLVIYSLAAPKRKDPFTGEVLSSCLKTTGEEFTNKTVDIHTGEVTTKTIEAATEEEINGTVKVMGGEDWMLWIKALNDANVLADNVKTIAYSYIGPVLTYPVYREGTIGKAKEDLENTAKEITEYLSSINGEGIISVNKGLVTQSSAAIPIVPLYISILFKLMKEKGTHEGCIEQIYRMFNGIYGNGEIVKDEKGRLRLDDYEMDEEIQAEVLKIWDEINTDNIFELSDVKGIKEDFYKLFGFGVDGVDYEADVDHLTV